MSNYVHVSLKLDRERDADIIAFLESKPKSYLIKEALRVYMQAAKVDAKQVIESVGGNREETENTANTDAGKLFSGFGGN